MNLLKSLEFAAQDYLAATSRTPKRSKVMPASESHRVIFWSAKQKSGALKLLKSELADWQFNKINDSQSRAAIQKFQLEGCTLWFLQPALYDGLVETTGHGQRLRANLYGKARDLAGSWLRMNKPKGRIQFEFYGSTQDEQVGALVGLGLASYVFIDAAKETSTENHRQWSFTVAANKVVSAENINRAYAIYSGMNIARHLTNLPANVVNPDSLSKALEAFFKNHQAVKVTIWDEKKLQQEKMGLLLGVGRGSVTGSRLVHLKYRARKKAKKNLKPLAFVGKGVTFDTGGLDLKPASGMRLMKKDMAGSAAMAGLCHMVSTLNLKTPCDFYLPLAENAVSATATRPGDVHMARNGLYVEIDNTDAEGRLVMADAFDVAIDQSPEHKPEALFDIATLTGAMRVAVGLDVAGYFSNSDKYAKETELAAQNFCESAWRMPLVQKYKKALSSTFADVKNSNDSGFGGAITAALFLEKFVKDTPWVHLDLMSWNNSADGALSEGANAQGFQILAGVLIGRG